MKRRKPPGFSFSSSRATGLTTAKRKFGKGTGVPLSCPGRQLKTAASIGCAVALIPVAGLLSLTLKLLAVTS